MLEQTINYNFKDKALLQNALTHSSYANENRGKKVSSNERLEFLGDSVMQIITSNYLYLNFPQLPEGELTKTRAFVVCEKSLCEFAKKINLGEQLLMGKGEECSGGRERASTLADAFESLLAAIYLDGGFEAASSFVMPFIKNSIDEMYNGKRFDDYKTLLQEIVQKNPGEILSYHLVNEQGPDHQKVFEVEVHLNSNVIGCGKGRSKKEAEQDAAREALKLLGEG